jgi:hypothetical protein
MAQTQINGGTQIRSGTITADRLVEGTLSKTSVGLGNVDNTSDANKPVSTATQTALDAKQAASEKGQANGYASLDSGGKVPVAQLPNSIMEYQGTWNAATNTPTLASGTGSAGDVYRVSVAGTALSLTFGVGDYVIYNGSTWEKSDTTDAVSSVAGRTGDVTLTSTDVGLGNVDNTSDANKPVSTATQTALDGKQATITAGTTSQYFRGDKTFQTLDKSAVGLGNVDNTTDANKPVSTAAQTALDLKLSKVDYRVREAPSGAVNGTNTAFTLLYTPVASSESVFLNGILQEPGSGNDYTISGESITYLSAPVTGDRIRVTYLRAPGEVGGWV